jgi:hypothetical protein
MATDKQLLAEILQQAGPRAKSVFNRIMGYRECMVCGAEGLTELCELHAADERTAVAQQFEWETWRDACA